MLLNSHSSMKNDQKDSDYFWCRKLTLKVKFCHLLKSLHYTNFSKFNNFLLYPSLENSTTSILVVKMQQKQIERISFSPFNNNYCLNINKNHLNKGIVPKTLKRSRWLKSDAEKIWFSSSKIAIQTQTAIIEFEVIVITVWPWAIWIKVRKPRQRTPQN